MTEKVLVIGGSGFIGHHLVQELNECALDVTSVSLNAPEEERQVSGVRYLTLDLVARDSLGLLAYEDYDYVVHLGNYIDHSGFWLGGQSVIEEHFGGLLNLLSILSRKKLKRFVFVGSSDEYGGNQAPQLEARREAPISPYAVSKVCSTMLLQMLSTTEGFPGVVLRLFLTYGPGQKSNRFLPSIITSCLTGGQFPVSAGSQLRDFCYVSDVVRAVISAMRQPDIEGEIFNVGSGQPICIKDVVEKVRAHVGNGSPQFGLIPFRKGENQTLFADIQKSEAKLGWQPEISFDAGLEMTVKWYRRKLCLIQSRMGWSGHGLGAENST